MFRVWASCVRRRCGVGEGRKMSRIPVKMRVLLWAFLSSFSKGSKVAWVQQKGEVHTQRTKTAKKKRRTMQLTSISKYAQLLNSLQGGEYVGVDPVIANVNAECAVKELWRVKVCSGGQCSDWAQEGSGRAMATFSSLCAMCFVLCVQIV